MSLELINRSRAGPNGRAIHAVLTEIARQYPSELVEHHLADIPRVAFHIQLIVDAKGRRASVCDVGGGTNLSSLGCAALGLEATVVDDFADNPPHLDDRICRAVLTLHRSYGVYVVKADVVRDWTGLAPAVFDAVTSFHSMEHWHHSPRIFFQSMVRSLKPGGLFLLCGPNCVNLRCSAAT